MYQFSFDWRGDIYVTLYHLFLTVIERRNTAVCQFASPLEVDQHNKPEVVCFASLNARIDHKVLILFVFSRSQAVVLEGKYWKRRLATVTAEYKKWRIFFKNQMMGRASKDLNDIVRFPFRVDLCFIDEQLPLYFSLGYVWRIGSFRLVCS